jgi:peptide/nickel transport system substrate-binding protein
MATDSNKNTRKPLAMNRRQFLRYTAIGGSAAAFLAACSAPGVTPSTGGEASAGEAAASAEGGGGGTMVWMGHQEVAALGPDDTGPDVQYVLIANIHNSLVWSNEFNELEPVLAESYEVSDDGLTYTFKLHQGVKFHDGTEFTAKDVKYTYDYYRNPDNAAVHIGDFVGVGSVETPDDYTVVVNMDEVNAASLVNWAGFGIVQSEYHAEVGEDTYKTAPIGTGAFKLKEWRAAEFTELEAFEDHFRGRPAIDVIRQDVVPEPSVRMIALQTGDADSSVWPLLVEDSLALKEDPNFTVFSTPGNSIKHFPLNNTLPQLSDKRVRQAMMYALDRQRIIDDLWSGAAQVAHSNFPPTSFYAKADLKKYDFDPEKAKALLDEAGWVEGGDGVREKDGEKLTFTITTITGDQARRPIAELAQQMLAEVGVDVQLAEAPVASILEGMRNGTMDASLFNWTYTTNAVEPDPFSTLHSDGGNNFAQYSNPRMDELIEMGTQIVDPEERKKIYDEIQEIFVEDVPVLYLQFDEWLIPFNNRIQGLPEDPKTATEYYLRANDWTLAE